MPSCAARATRRGKAPDGRHRRVRPALDAPRPPRPSTFVALAPCCRAMREMAPRRRDEGSSTWAGRPSGEGRRAGTACRPRPGAGGHRHAPPRRKRRGPGGPLSPRRVRMVFFGLMLALLLAALEQMIVATALPKIVGELHGLDKMSWAITAYLLTSTIGLPVYGKLGDLFGRKGVFHFAIVVFIVGSALAGWSRTMDQLIAFRALQGVGARRTHDRRPGDHRGHRAAPGARPLHGPDRRRLRPRLGRRAAARRLLHRPRLLALVLLLQRALRRCSRSPSSPSCSNCPSRRSGASLDVLGALLLAAALHLPGPADQLGRHGVRLGLARHPRARRRRGRHGPALPRRRALRGRTPHPAAAVPRLGLQRHRPGRRRRRRRPLRRGQLSADVPADGRRRHRHRVRAADAAR